MKFKCGSILCHVECLTLENGALRCSGTPPLAVCQSTRCDNPGDLNRRYYCCETLSVSLVITFSSCLLPKMSLLLCFLSFTIYRKVCPSTVSGWNQTCLLYLCSPDRKSMAHKHTADSTKQALACLAVTYAMESQSFKSVTRFINRRSSLVSLSVPTPHGLFFLNIISHAMFVYRNIGARSSDHCCRWKAPNIKYYERVSVFLP